MNCQNCGAPMLLVREREYFICEYCGSFHFPAASRDGVRLLGQAPERIPCPICRNPLLLASFDDQFKGYHCQSCRGILLDRNSFGTLVQRRRAWTDQPPDAPQPMDRRGLERRVHCPRCERPMSTHPYFGPGNIVIDTCDACEIIWLDYGEMGQVVNAPGRDRGAALLKKLKKPETEESDQKRRRKGGRHKIDLTELLDDLFS